MPRVADMQNPFTDRIAEGLYGRTPRDEVIALTGAVDRDVWHLATVEVREIFRARARRFMAGDMSMLPWSMPPGMGLPG